MSSSIYFYDLETSGFNPREARIMQFAGQRVDMDLQPIGEPHNFLIKLSDDILPEPDAILVTGITPQQTIADGITEAEFLKIFQAEIATPNTIFAGFNSIRFDDEFIRYMLYRNFYDPYEWQWKDGRSRWDLLDVVRMTRALRPNGIKWPVDSTGAATNRLELLTKLNKLDHSHAHDALNDVQATIAVAQLIKHKQSDLFSYLLKVRDKKQVAALVSNGPFVYTSGKYSSDYDKTTVAIKLAESPKKQGVLVYDLRFDPTPFLAMNAQELVEAWKWVKDATEPRLPIKTLQFNRCPAVAPLSVLSKENGWERIKLNQTTIETNLKKLQTADDFVRRVYEALAILDKAQQLRFLADDAEVDSKLYDGFIPDVDKPKMSQLHAASLEELISLKVEFKDERLNALLPLYKARNYPRSLSDTERLEWELFRERKLLSGKQNSRLARYFARLSVLAGQPNLTQSQRYILEELQLYAQSIMPTEFE